MIILYIMRTMGTLSTEIQSLRKKVRSGAERALTPDQRPITGELGLIDRMLRKDPSSQEALARLARLEKRVEASIRKREARQNHLPEITYPIALPITQRKDEIIEAIRSNQVVVITGETGSGKTTQIPKMCLEAGRGIDGLVGCTQPRRIATITVAKRIADELNEEVERSVGYKIRFQDKTNRDIHIKLMTDGVLLMETQSDRFLNAYDTLIIDEAHERSTNIDFLLGILKGLLGRRKDLKLIITSATIDPGTFSKAFGNAPIIEVSGRMYPVAVRYRPIDQKSDEDEASHVDAAVSVVDELEREGPPGDILIFMPTQQDIVDTCAALTGRTRSDATVLPLFGRLSSSQQQRVFARTRTRKIVVATNVAETSITIPGIRYVIDTGLARISEYNPGTRTGRLPVKAISKSSAIQRKGRCGRVQDGICVRLYAEEDYESRPFFTPPEILRSNLAEVILRMIALKIGDIASFPFIDRPNPATIRDGFALLRELGAVKTEGNKTFLTESGRAMSRLPLDPRIARMIIDSEKEGCLEEVIIIASALSIQDPRERPLEKKQEADRMHKAFANPASDFITLLNIWNRYQEVSQELKTQNRIRRFCKDHFLSYRRMREWEDVYEQISQILKEAGILKGAGKRLRGDELYEGIHKAILGGYISSIGIKKEKNIYQMAKGKEAMIFPGSGLFNRGGDWIVSAELVETSKLFARLNAVIRPDWLEEIGDDLCSRTYLEAHWEKSRGEVVASEQVKLHGLIIVPGRSVSYGRINPVEASKIFIRSALVEGDIRNPPPFLMHNRGLIEEVTDMEDKIRRRNILVSEDILTRFYEERIGITYNIQTLKKLIKDRGTDRFLRMNKEEIMGYYPEEEIAQYPDEITLGTRVLPCSYHFEPGQESDGITIRIPSDAASQLPLEAADWHIPALLREKVMVLVKGLPKEYRKKLVPIPQTVESILHDIKNDGGALITSLARFIHERFNISIPASAWPIESIPDHLKMRFSVVNERGEEVRSGRDIGLLRGDAPAGGESPAFKSAKKRWEQEGITAWNFEDLPESIDLGAAGDSAYPALERGKDGRINIRLFGDKEKAATTNRQGVAGLYELYFRKNMKFLKKHLTLPQELQKVASSCGGAGRIEQALYQKTIQTLFERDIRKREVFIAHSESAERALLPQAQELLQSVIPAIKACGEAGETLRRLGLANRSNRAVQDFITDLRRDISRLMPENFVEIYESDRLNDIPRYLRAVMIRAGRGITHLEKDAVKAGKIKPFIDKLEEMPGQTPLPSEERKHAIEEYAWMVEEYKISVFAPEMKTTRPVSPKRLKEMIEIIDRMI
ncbi:MAG: ATP-dependent RNA helicase HrpA [Syntrophales bacterium]|nr:ATP-dependent RNA helicase HrpA [Syntrophales bacterium]